MKRLKIKLRNSISGRLASRVLIASAIIIILTFVLLVRTTANRARATASKHAQVELVSTIHQIDAVLRSVETAIDNMSWLVAENVDSPEFMYHITEKLLQNNDFIYGSAVAWEPDFYPSKGHFYSPYSYRDENGVIQSKQLGTASYDYHYMEWYQIPKLLKKAYWSEPYYDDGGGEMMMATYSKPLYDENGKMFAVITADISLEKLTDLVSGIEAFDNSYNLMVSRNASYIVHPDHELILNETLYSSTLGEESEALKQMQRDMTGGCPGEVLIENATGSHFVFYSPVHAIGWSVAIVCPMDELYASVKNIRNMMIVIGVIALLVLMVTCYVSIRKVVAPIEEFSHTAREIAEGDFSAALPEINTNDELQELRGSFKYLQKSLVEYVEELKATTANKERIESELRIARAIQMGMVPKIFPPFPERKDLALAAKLIPAKEVGGDLYDFFIEDEKLYFIIGDVSGKGVPASLLMAVTCRLFRSIAAHFVNPEDIMASLNDSLSEGNDSNMFCTAFLGILDVKTGALSYCNAGHNPPLVIDENGKVSALKLKSNLALGLYEGFPYEGETMTLEHNTMLYMYTDGVNEAENKDKDQYGEDRLLSALTSDSLLEPSDYVDLTLKELKLYTDGAEQSDDITIMGIKYC